METIDVRAAYERGLALMLSGAYFEAHEELELAWRAAADDERDFFQGLVHVTVAWYQAQRGNTAGCNRQLEKAKRRLRPYAPSHRGLDVDDVLAQVATAQRVVERGALALPELRLNAEPDRPQQPVPVDLQPPVAVEEEQQPERDEE